MKNGIPWALTDENFELDGETIPNPLRSFVFTKNITDNINGDNPNYSKPKGYETVRYPLSGLVGTPDGQCRDQGAQRAVSRLRRQHELLNQNIVELADIVPSSWTARRSDRRTSEDKFRDCLDAPNYTVFSNTTSAAEWNEHQSSGGTPRGAAGVARTTAFTWPSAALTSRRVRRLADRRCQRRHG